MEALVASTPHCRAGEAVALVADVCAVVWNHWPVSHRLGRAAEGSLHRAQVVPIAAEEHVDRPQRFVFERRSGRAPRPRSLPPDLRSHISREVTGCTRLLDLRAASEPDRKRREQIEKLSAIVHNLGRYVELEPDQ